jgi:glycerol kinase
MGYLNLADLGWNKALLGLQAIDEAVLPSLVDTWGPLGATATKVFGASVPIAAIIADQQSALIGHGAEDSGEVKITYGTSGTLDAGTGGGLIFKGMAMPPFVVSHVAGETRFCLEGMVLSAGSAMDWLRRTFRLGDHAAFEAMAASAPDAGGVAFLPALQGLGAPNPDPSRRATLTGLSSASGAAQIARAGLEGVAFRVRQILDQITAGDDLPKPLVLKVDGGLAASDTLLQIQADIAGLPVARHALRDAAAVGAAIGAGLGAGILTRKDAMAFTRHDRVFEPNITADEAATRLAAWREQVHA